MDHSNPVNPSLMSTSTFDNLTSKPFAPAGAMCPDGNVTDGSDPRSQAVLPSACMQHACTDVPYQHGCLIKIAEHAPYFGTHFSHDLVGIGHVPAGHVETHFRTDVDFVSVPLRPSLWKSRCNEDELREISVGPGQINIHFAGSKRYARSVGDPADFMQFRIDPHLRRLFFRDVKPKRMPDCSRSYAGVKTPNSRALGKLALSMYKSKHFVSRMASESFISLVLADVLEGLNREEDSQTPAKTMSTRSFKTTKDYIVANLGQNLGLVELAELSQLSVRQFIRQFRSATGQTPYQFIIEKRLERARELIEQRHSLADVAYAAGFSSQAHMTDTFRRKLGITPGQLRADGFGHKA